jgi:hypothetical protein
MGLIHSSEQKNLQFAVGAINRAAGVPQGLTDADVVLFHPNLAAAIAQLEVVKNRVNPSDQHEIQAVENWITWLQGTGNLPDSTINTLTNVRTSNSNLELRFQFFNLVAPSETFTDPTYADTLVSHPNL